MQPFAAFTKLPKVPYSLTIGTFDGVHLGHQSLITRLKETASANGTQTLVITFSPHPAEVLRGPGTIKLLTTPHERTFYLKSLAVDSVVTMPFTQALSKLTALDFLQKLSEIIDLRCMLVGYDFTLGHKREGNYARIKQISSQLGFEAIEDSPLEIDGQPVSSTNIRHLIQNGAVDKAAELLSRYYTLSGAVISGDGRGHKLGFPTANVDYPEQKVLPQLGVYAAWVQLGKAMLPAVTNIGVRPTFTSSSAVPVLEPFILADVGNIYGKELTVHFVKQLRTERRFDSVETLKGQIEQDKIETMEVLRHAKTP